MKFMRGLLASIAALALGAALLLISAESGPATAQRACSPNLTASQFSPLIVSFDTGSVNIRDADMPRIAAMANLAKDNYIQQICVTGYADKQGDARMNQLLSQRRADAVATALRKHGIAADAIVVSSAGEPGGNAFSGAQYASAADRRVEIKFAR
jgi:outer membrane protein OmpA-like peptidoglycan-associated protein